MNSSPIASPAISAPIAHGHASRPATGNTPSKIAGGTSVSSTAAARRSFIDLPKRFRIETVADTADGQNQFGIGVVAFDMAAQAAHVDVNRARLDEGVAPPYQVE